MTPMLAVANVRRSLAFYCDVLGMRVVSDPAVIDEWNWCTLRASGANEASGAAVEIMLAGVDWQPQLPPGPHEFSAIYYFYPEDVRALRDRMIEHQIGVTELEETFYGMLEFSCRDPDGHLLSFGQSQPPTAGE